MNARAFFPIAVGVLLAVAISVELVRSVRAVLRERAVNEAKSTPVVVDARRSVSCGNGVCVFTIEHDGHLFIVTGGGGVLHHPDCK